MADGHLVADDQWMGIVSDMEHTEVLHIRPVADPDKVHVPANDGMKPDAAVLAQHDIADDHAGLFDKTGRGNGGFDSLKCADHAAHCRGIGPRPARGVMEEGEGRGADPLIEGVSSQRIVDAAEVLKGIVGKIPAPGPVRSNSTMPDGFGIPQ